jgi:hypothetical protein
MPESAKIGIAIEIGELYVIKRDRHATPAASRPPIFFKKGEILLVLDVVYDTTGFSNNVTKVRFLNLTTNTLYRTSGAAFEENVEYYTDGTAQQSEQKLSLRPPWVLL